MRQLQDRSLEKLSELALTLALTLALALALALALHDAGQHERWHDLVLSDIGTLAWLSCGREAYSNP